MDRVGNEKRTGGWHRMREKKKEDLCQQTKKSKWGKLKREFSVEMIKEELKQGGEKRTRNGNQMRE